MNCFAKSKFLCLFAAAMIPAAGCRTIENSRQAEELAAFKQSDIIGRFIEGGSNAPAELGLSIKFTATTSGPSKYHFGNSRQTDECELILTNGFCILSVLTTYADPPVYNQPVIGSIPYLTDSEGLKMIGRVVSTYCVIDRERNLARENSEVYKIRTDNSIVRTNYSAEIFKYEIGDYSRTYLLNTFRLVSGTGLGRYLSAIGKTTAPESPDGLAMVKASGTCGGEATGAWSIKYDPAVGWLVREGIFTPDGVASPWFVVDTVGSKTSSNMTIAASGTYRALAGTFSMEFKVLDFQTFGLSDSAMRRRIDELLNLINSPGPNGEVRVIDLPPLASYKRAKF